MWELYLQFIVDGLMIGMVYALIAMGLTMIYGMMHIVNLAHGEIYMLGGVFAFFLTKKIGISFFPAFVISVLIVFLFGLVLDRLLMRRIRGAPHVMTAAITAGLSLFLANTIHVIMGPVPQSLSLPFELKAIFLGPIILNRTNIFAATVTIIVILFTNWMIKHTKLGRAMRATIQDNMAAQLSGINVDYILAFGFAYGSALAAIAGVLLGSLFVVTPFMGESMVLKAWTVVIVGGLGNIPGAIFAGLLIGVVESLAAGIWTSGWSNVAAFVIVVIVLLLRPQGLFNRG
jgi:branched-chain amino acid transport system permease protein